MNERPTFPGPSMSGAPMTSAELTNTLSHFHRAEIARIRATRAGTGEISYYGALAGALNAAGEKLKPRVFCVPNLRNRGAGFPDMGLFVTGRGHAPAEWPEAQAPTASTAARGSTRPTTARPMRASV